MGLFQILDISSDDVEIISGESKFIITLYGKSDQLNDSHH